MILWNWWELSIRQQIFFAVNAHFGLPWASKALEPECKVLEFETQPVLWAYQSPTLTASIRPCCLDRSYLLRGEDNSDQLSNVWSRPATNHQVQFSTKGLPSALQSYLYVFWEAYICGKVSNQGSVSRSHQVGPERFSALMFEVAVLVYVSKWG